jgi:hypothetical protein
MASTISWASWISSHRRSIHAARQEARFGRLDSYAVDDTGYEAAINEAARPRGAHLAVEQLDNGRWRAAIEQPDPLGTPVILLAAEHADRSEALRLLLSEARRW